MRVSKSAEHSITAVLLLLESHGPAEDEVTGLESMAQPDHEPVRTPVEPDPCSPFRVMQWFKRAADRLARA